MVGTGRGPSGRDSHAVSARCRLAGPPIRFAGELSGLVTDTCGQTSAGRAWSCFLISRTGCCSVPPPTWAGLFPSTNWFPTSIPIRVSFASFVPAKSGTSHCQAGHAKPAGSESLPRFQFRSAGFYHSRAGRIDERRLEVDAAFETPRFGPSCVSFPPVRSVAVSGFGRSGTEPGQSGDVQRIARNGANLRERRRAELPARPGKRTWVPSSRLQLLLHGGNRVQVSGNVGYAATSGRPLPHSGPPTAAILWGPPRRVSVTMRQLYVPFRLGQSGIPGTDNAPTLRTLAISYADKMEISDVLSAGIRRGTRYGLVSRPAPLPQSLCAAELRGRERQDRFHLDVRQRPARTRMSPDDPNADLQRDLAALSVVPRVTLDDGRPRVQRGDDYEIGMTQKFGSREFRVAAYNEHVSNTSLMIANPEGGPVSPAN